MTYDIHVKLPAASLARPNVDRSFVGPKHFLRSLRNREGLRRRSNARHSHADRRGKRFRPNRDHHSRRLFLVPRSDAGDLHIAIEAPGSRRYRQTGILINADEQRSMGQVKLQIGQVSESVTVTADAVTVNLVTGERAGTLSGEQLDEIALRGRDIFDAVSLMPGVVDTSDGRDAPSPTSISNIYILGGRDDQKNMTIDGVTNLDTGSNNAVHSMPSMDSVAEVKVLMSAYSAENGRNPSSINVITKGGGTQLHGQAAWYFRNEDLNANNYFSNEAGRPRQEYRYNIGSYYIGGPVILPKIHPRQKESVLLLQPGIPEPGGAVCGRRKDRADRAGATGRFLASPTTPTAATITVNDPLEREEGVPREHRSGFAPDPDRPGHPQMFPLPNFVDPNLATRYNWNYYVAASEPYNRRTETARVDYVSAPELAVVSEPQQ